MKLQIKLEHLPTSRTIISQLIDNQSFEELHNLLSKAGNDELVNLYFNTDKFTRVYLTKSILDNSIISLNIIN